MKKKCNVVMLPTEKATPIILHSTGLDKVYHTKESGENAVLNIGGSYQHLYFTSDDKIDVGDYFYRYQDKSIRRVEQLGGCTNIDKKVIASTDPKLSKWSKIEGDRSNRSIYIELPQIPESFIEEYVKNPVDEAIVEYKEIVGSLDEGITTFPTGDFVPKLQDNHIIISPVEEKMYTKEDLMGNQDGSLDHFLLHSIKYTQEEREIILEAIYNWTQQNL